tara:strand:- start:61 stop:246 length:186 start_codon:yes stop_codon:yes gene_type:complete
MTQDKYGRVLIEGLEGEPLLKTEESRRRFGQNWYEIMKPKLDACARMRTESALAAMHHIVD